MAKREHIKPEHRCGNCDGEGTVANSDGQERLQPSYRMLPWSHYRSGSDLSVRLGLVKPIDCPECAGTGISDRATPEGKR